MTSRFCRPWWCLSGHHRFHITYRQLCISSRDRRLIRYESLKHAAYLKARQEFAAWKQP